MTTSIDDFMGEVPELIKTPYQGLNAILGGGLRGNEVVAVIGAPLNYVPELFLDLKLGAGLYNRPELKKDAIPLIVDIQVSGNITEHDLMTHERYKQISSDDSYRHLTRSGCEFFTAVLHDYTQYTVYDLMDQITDLENQGYYIYQLTFPQFGNICKTDGDGVAMTHRDMVGVLRHFNKYRNALMFLGFGISNDGKKIIDKLPNNYLRKIASVGYYGDGYRISQELDCEIFVSHNTEEVSLLCGKHRGAPSLHYQVSYRVGQHGRIVPDVCEHKVIKDLTADETLALTAKFRAVELSDVPLPLEFSPVTEVGKTVKDFAEEVFNDMYPGGLDLTITPEDREPIHTQAFKQLNHHLLGQTPKPYNLEIKDKESAGIPRGEIREWIGLRDTPISLNTHAADVRGVRIISKPGYYTVAGNWSVVNPASELGLYLHRKQLTMIHLQMLSSLETLLGNNPE